MTSLRRNKPKTSPNQDSTAVAKTTENKANEAKCPIHKATKVASQNIGKVINYGERNIIDHNEERTDNSTVLSLPMLNVPDVLIHDSTNKNDDLMEESIEAKDFGVRTQVSGSGWHPSSLRDTTRTFLHTDDFITDIDANC